MPAKLTAVLVFVLTARFVGAGSLNVGDRFPPLQGKSLEGALPALEGKILYVDFWASWCEPCRVSFSEMEKIHTRYKDRGFSVVAVNLDEDAGAMAAFLKGRALSFPVVRDARQLLVAAVGIEAMPTSLLLDRKGRIVAIHRGFKGRETVEQLIQEIETLLQNEAHKDST
jgi:thiol-disulfide isomerase/thioredoxin